MAQVYISIGFVMDHGHLCSRYLTFITIFERHELIDVHLTQLHPIVIFRKDC